MTEAGKDALPAWLHFAPGLNVLKGIPSPADAGQLYLEVVAHGHDGQNVTDIFSVFVSADTPAMSSGQPLKFKKSGPEAVRCKREEPETVATIVVDADLEGMAVEQRLQLLSNFLSHMGLMEEMVKMVPAKEKLLQDDTALVTGSGDATEPRFPGLSVSWLVGCGKVRGVAAPLAFLCLSVSVSLSLSLSVSLSLSLSVCSDTTYVVYWALMSLDESICLVLARRVEQYTALSCCLLTVDALRVCFLFFVLVFLVF